MHSQQASDPGSLPPTIDGLISAARQTLDPAHYAWAVAGAGEEVTLGRNSQSLKNLALLPRVLTGIEEASTSTTLLGVPLAVPVLMAPVGALSLFHPGDAEAAAAGAAAAGTSAFCATQVANVTWESVASTAPGRHFLQVYPFGDRDWMERVVDRAGAAGFAAIALTADSPMIGRRDRSIAAGYTWSNPEPLNLVELGVDVSARARFGWDDLEWLCARSPLPVMLKGVTSSADAGRAVGCGVASVYVSNHGGRTVDHAVSTIEVLEEVVESVGGAVDVVVDSGFTRGSEVVKALALGAKAVGFGKLQCLALALAGARGVTHLVELLRAEIATTMTNIGCADPGALSREHVRWSTTTTGPNPYVET